MSLRGATRAVYRGPERRRGDYTPAAFTLTFGFGIVLGAVLAGGGR